MSAKAQSLAAELQNELAKRFTTITAVQQDTDGLPWFQVGTAGAGQQTAVVKVQDFDVSLWKDGIGQNQRVYGAPVKIQVVLEQIAGNTGTAILTAANALLLMGTLMHRGSRIELYMSANANSVDTTDITSGNLKQTFDPDPKYRLMSQI